MLDLICMDTTKQVNLNTSDGLGIASARFCYAAAGLPADVVGGFLELLETYSVSDEPEEDLDYWVS